MLKQRKRLAAAAVLATLVVLSGWLHWRAAAVAAAGLTQSGEDRTVDIERQTRMDPLTITKVMVGDQQIQPGQSSGAREDKPGTTFQADEDWLKNMSIVLKNRTDKVIAHVEIQLFFPDTGDGSASRPVTAYTIALGQVPDINSFTSHGQKIPPDSSKQPLLLAPGQTLVIRVADYIDGIRDMLEQFPGALVGGSPILQVTRVTIDRLQLFFVDGLRWKNLDGFAVPDPNRPGRYTNPGTTFFPGRSSQNWPPSE
jgi:hypothetical protein